MCIYFLCAYLHHFYMYQVRKAVIFQTSLRLYSFAPHRPTLYTYFYNNTVDYFSSALPRGYCFAKVKLAVFQTAKSSLQEIFL